MHGSTSLTTGGSTPSALLTTGPLTINGGLMLLLIDGRCSSVPSPGMVRSFIKGLCRHIKMSPLGDAKVVVVADGFSVVQFIIESHIVIHVQDDYINIDIFSCKSFDSVKAISFCRRGLNIAEPFKSQVLSREFGKEMRP